MELVVTPYRICTSIFIKVYCSHRANLAPRENGRICLFILDIIRQNEYTFKQLNEMIESKCDSIINGQFRRLIDDTIVDINNLFELVKQMRDCSNVDNNSVAGLYLRKLTIYFDRLTHQACSRLYDDLITYVSHLTSTNVRRRGSSSVAWQTPRTTRSSGVQQAQTPASASDYSFKYQQQHNVRPIYQVNHEIARLQANEDKAMNPRDLYESIKRPNNTCKSDATFLRYLNLLRVNESVGSKHLLLAYFDMVSDTVSRSYSALNYAIWYLHHGEYKRAIECLQECYCCAQAADDDKCLLIALMWLARILIQAKQKNSSKYNVRALLELVRKRSHKAGMAYVQAMSSMTLEQLVGPVDDSEMLKKSSETLKQVAQSSRQQNLLLTTSNQPNPLDKEDGLPSAETLAVRNSMNDVLAMYYALLSAHLNLLDANQSSALASQTLLHFDLIEKCGNEDVFLMNENTFIAIRNLAHHVWNSTRDIHLVREILVDLCSSKIPKHRTDNHSIWRQAYAEISFEHHIEQQNWSEASKMISIIKETDQDGAQLRNAELLKCLDVYDEALLQVDDLINRIEFEESNLTDPIDSNRIEAKGTASLSRQNGTAHSEPSAPIPSLSIEHRSFIKSKALLLRAILLNDEPKILESLQYATENRFMHIKTACLMQLARRWVDKTDKIMDSIVVEVFANGTRLEKQELRKLLKVL
jgi:tetratricopeptide (TPR) repeat protein